MEFIQPEDLTPSAILAIYKSSQSYYVEKHNVRNGQVLAGHPCTKRSLSQMANAIIQEHENYQIAFRGMSTVKLIAFAFANGHLRAAWDVPAQSRQMFFTRDLNIPAGKVRQPRMIFFVDGRTLRVFAVKGKKRITDKTKLYIVPFHNMAMDGSVCLGSAQLRQKSQMYLED